MAAEYEVELLEALLDPVSEFALHINGSQVEVPGSVFSEGCISISLKISENVFNTEVDVFETKTEILLPVNIESYTGTLLLKISVVPIIEYEEIPNVTFNCRYLRNIEESKTSIEKTKNLLAHLESIMGPSYQKMLEDVVRPSSPTRSPLKVSSKPGGKTPVKTPGTSGKSPYKRSTSGLSFDQGGVIEIPCSSDIVLERVSGKDASSLVLVVAGLLARKRLTKGKSDEDELIKNILSNNEKSCEVMKAAFSETKSQVESEKEDIKHKIQMSSENIEELTSKLNGLQSVSSDLAETQKNLENEVKTLMENAEVLRRVSIENSEELLGELFSTRKKTEEIENERKNIQESYSKYLAEFKAEMTEKDREISKKQDALNKSVTEFSQKDIQLTQIVQENSKLNGQILELSSEIALKLSHSQRCDLLKSLISDDSKAVSELQSQLSHFEGLFENLCQETEKKIESIKMKKDSIDQECEQLNNDIEKKSSENSELAETLNKLKASLSEIRALYQTTLQIENIFNNLQKRMNFTYETKEHVLKEMKYLSDLILHLTSCYTIAHRSYGKSKSLLDQKNCEIITLKEALDDLKQKYPVYFPVKEDSLDVALGNYLNSRDLPLNVPFIREGGGAYFFGTRKVLVMYERSKIIVKVGGGFLPIEEFIQAYSDVEIEKFQARCQELSPNTKKFLGKWVGGLVDSPGDSKKNRDTLMHATEEHKYTIGYGVRSPERSLSPPKRSKTSTS